MTRSLLISLSESLTPPTEDHNLLLAFHFGDSPPTVDHPGVVRTQLSPVDRDELYECWWVSGEVKHSTDGPIRVAESNDYAVVVFEDDEQRSENFVDFTYTAYRNLLNVVQSTRHPRLLKIWNYMGGINDGEGDQERYRRFSTGRAMAFKEVGMQDSDAPTGTGIGTTHANGLAIIALSSRKKIHLSENPRQISAFHYPRRYGPRSPKFSRAGLLDMQNYHLYLISGTASIVGHESVHPDDTAMQLNETLRNLDALCDEFSLINPDWPPLNLGEQSILRVYLREPDDYDYVARQLEKALAPGRYEATFLHGDICRSELTIEIDGLQLW